MSLTRKKRMAGARFSKEFSMTDIPLHRRLAGWRIAGWSAAAALLALPAIAMQFATEVNWTAGDFVVAAALLLLTGLAAEGGLRLARSWSHLAGFALATFTAFFTVWSNLAVGIIGDEHEAINLGYLALIGVAIVASAAGRFRASVMAAVAGALALGQLALGLVAEATMPGHAVEWGFLAMFALMWLAAAASFRHHASA